MAQSPKDITEASDAIKAGWKKYASAATFAGLTEAQYEAKIQASYDIRSQISEHQKAIDQLIADRELADVATNKTNQLVIKGIVGDVNYGDDSDLYGACGYIRASEKKSGLTRKKNNTAKAAAAK
jgi:hypothetical protein